MSIIAYKLSCRRLLVPFAIAVFSLLVFQPAPQKTAACVEQNVPISQWPAGRVAPGWLFPPRRSYGLTASDLKNTAQVQIPVPIGGGAASEAQGIAKNGPLFPAVFSMSSFSVSGFVKGRSPVVIVYELEAESAAVMTISVKGAKQPFVVELTPTNDRRTEVIRQLPEAFGQKPQVGVLNFQAFKTGPGGRKPARFFLYGLGVGDHAVGSMVIDQLQFQPGSIRPKLKEKASYSFRSLSDFGTVAAEFMLITFSPDRGLSGKLAAREMLNKGVRRGESVAKDWDGKNSNGKISLGPHQFYLRAWRGLKSGGDWVFAAENQLVKVE